MSEHNYGRVLDIPAFQYTGFLYMTEIQKVLNITEYCSDYATVLDMPGQSFARSVLNMPGLRLWQSCEYVRVAQDSVYA